MTPWYLPVARAIPALALAVVVTFSSDHSTPLGYLVFGIWAVVTGGVLGFGALRSSAGVERGIRVAQGLVTLAAGVIALVLPGGGLPFFIFLVTATAAITGFLEIYLGLRARGTQSTAKDSIFVGALTALLAIVVLLVPPGFVQPYTVDDKAFELTASIIVVGVLGAYWAIVGVYLVIAGLSLKWAPNPDDQVVAPGTPTTVTTSEA